MDIKLVIEELEKTRESLLKYGGSTEQLKAINYAIKIFKTWQLLSEYTLIEQMY